MNAPIASNLQEALAGFIRSPQRHPLTNNRLFQNCSREKNKKDLKIWIFFVLDPKKSGELRRRKKSLYLTNKKSRIINRWMVSMNLVPLKWGSKFFVWGDVCWYISNPVGNYCFLLRFIFRWVGKTVVPELWAGTSSHLSYNERSFWAQIYLVKVRLNLILRLLTRGVLNQRFIAMHCPTGIKFCGGYERMDRAHPDSGLLARLGSEPCNCSKMGQRRAYFPNPLGAQTVHKSK